QNGAAPVRFAPQLDKLTSRSVEKRRETGHNSYSMSESPERTGAKKSARARAIRFFGLASGLLFAAIGAIALAVRFDFFGAGFHVNFAFILGVAGVILLGVGLMAL